MKIINLGNEEMSVISTQPFYHLRPNKYIDRCLFVNVLNCLSKPYSLHEYQYIGFGSFQFDDFKLIHTYLGISKMISLESDPLICSRAEFNKPLKCITIKNTDSTDFISKSELDQNSIFWFDYTSPKDLGKQFSDFCTLLNKANVHDIIKITLNAYPAALLNRKDEQSDQEVQEQRLKILEQMIKEYMPTDTDYTEMEKDKYPLLLLKCIKKACSQTLNELSYPKRFVFPIISTVYQDGQQMLTFTGIILEALSADDKQRKEEDIVKMLNLHQDITFGRWDSLCKIDVPCLTPKEILALNNLLPDTEVEQKIKEELPFFCNQKKVDVSIKNYTKYYKYYPNFHHVNF